MIVEAALNEIESLAGNLVRLEPWHLGHAQRIAGRLAVLGVEVPAAAFRVGAIHEEARSNGASHGRRIPYGAVFCLPPSARNLRGLLESGYREGFGLARQIPLQPRIICKTRHSPGSVRTTRSG